MMQDETQLLREENATLREEMALLRALLNDLLPLKTEVEELRAQVKQLESRLGKDSHKSHLPPSSDRFGKPTKTKSLRRQSGKKKGAQPGHEGNPLSQVKKADQIIVHEVQTCQTCQPPLSQELLLGIECRQVLALPPKRVMVSEHQAQQKYCPGCQQISQAAFPEGVDAPVQESPAFGALGVSLVHQQLLPYARACETIQDLIGPAMTVGTRQALVERCAQQVIPVEEQIQQALQQSRVIHQDETSLKVTGTRYWMHASVTEHLTHYAVPPKRGAEALDAIGILARFTGVSIHDGWATSWQYLCQHALWNVHHLPELTFLQEQHQDWAGSMIRRLTSMNQAVKEAREAGQSHLDPQTIAYWKAQYHLLLQEGWQANPPDPPDGMLKRGRKKQSAARNLLHRLDTHQEAVLLFLERFDVAFDKSQAQRDIRLLNGQQKVSGGFRSLPGAQALCRIRGYLSPLCKQGAHRLTALEWALAGHPVFPAF